MIKIEKNIDITTELVDKIIEEHDISGYQKLQDYYEGKHDILYRDVPDTTQPNNRLVNGFPTYIVDVLLGYFIGKPVSYTSMQETLMEKMQEILDYNDEQDENVQLAKVMGIKGKVYELLYMDEDSFPRFGVVDPDECILVYDNSINPSPLFAIRYFTTKDPTKKEKIQHIEVYTKENIYQYERKIGEEGATSKGKMSLISSESHNFGDVPIIEFPNNDERMGDFEKVLTLVDAYDLAQSNSANTFEYNDDAFLKISNMSGTTNEDISQMKKNRAVLVDGDGDVGWITKTENDAALENYKNRIQDDIHRFSNTPNLTDESFAGNLSGVALEFKLWGLEQVASQKERKFKRSLQRRFELLLNIMVIQGSDYKWQDITIAFTRNMPMNLTEIVDTVIKLKGIISTETLLNLLPFVEDPAKERELMEQEYLGMAGELDKDIPDEDITNEDEEE